MVGLRFNDVIGSSLNDVDNYITITKDYVYDKGEVAATEGISLPADSSSHIGYTTKDNERLFHYDVDNPPVLVVGDDQDFSTLEQEPAIRRKPKKQE